MNEAIPWKSRRSPKAFVKFSNPNKSTRMTDVSPTRQIILFVSKTAELNFIQVADSPTYAPIVKPNTAAYTASPQNSTQNADKTVATPQIVKHML